MRISALARLAEVGIETVRFYEREGLIDRPARPAHGGFRSYPAETAQRIRFIRQAQGLGFSLKEVGDLLSLRTDPAADCGEVRARAQEKLEDVNRKIARLSAIQGALQELIWSCPGRGVAARRCSILEALDAVGWKRATSEGRAVAGRLEAEGCTVGPGQPEAKGGR